MDIPVSRLNERMALRLPAQFPLGLVFVVGTVEALSSSANGDQALAFFLSESDCRLRCTLSERASSETELKNGYRIRAGGHLAFDAQKADYYLLARDVEVIPLEQPRVTSLAAIIADQSKRSEQAGLIPAELPEWVKRMAPQEIGIETERSSPVMTETVAVQPVVSVEGVSTRPPGLLGLGHEVAVAGLSDDLIDFLSEAMDSDEEIELTPEMVAGFNPQGSGSNSTPSGSKSVVFPEDGAIQTGAISSEHSTEEESEDQEEAAGTGKKRTYLWIFILILMIVALMLGAAFLLTEYVV